MQSETRNQDSGAGQGLSRSHACTCVERSSGHYCYASGLDGGAFGGAVAFGRRLGQRFGQPRTLFDNSPIYPPSCSRRKLVRTQISAGSATTDNASSSPPARRARYAHSTCYGNTRQSERQPDLYSVLRSSRPPSVACAQRSSRPTLVLSLTSTTSCPRKSN